MQTLSPGALIPYLAYLNWAAEEHRLGYPPAHFARLLDTMVRVPKQSIGEQGQIELELTPIAIIPPQLKQSLLALFSLLSRLVAHSAKSGCTPPTLAPLFGVLMFGLDAPTVAPNPSASFGTAPGAPSHPFTTTYTSYLRSTHAMEHLILSFIRWQDTPLSLGGGGIGASGVGGVPTRCKEWVREYPRGLSNHQAVLALVGQGGGGGGFAQGGRGALGPRKGAKTLRLVSVKRTVPVYDPDLVASCGRWDRIGVGSYSASSSFNSSSSLYTLAGSKEWERISPHSGSKEKGREKEKLPPKYSDSYRKRMNIPVGVEPGTLPGSPLSLSRSTSSNSSYGNTSSFYGRGSTISTFTYGIGGLSGGSTPTSPSTPNGKDSSERFKTLTDAQWGLFESSGFLSSSSSSLSTSSTTIDSALKFDLTESARKARLNLNRSSSNDGDQGRNPGVSWGDFVSAGFDARERDRDGGMPLVVSTGTGAGGMNYGVAGVASPGRRGLGSAGSSGGGTGYLDTKGKPTDVGEFTLDTGLDAALQFNLAEFGVWSLRDKDKDREKERERERTGSFGLAKRLKKKEKPLPPFTHDTTPLLGSEALVEAAFVDVWVDLVCWGFAGGGMGMEGSDSDYANSNSTALTLSRSISATGDDEEREREREKERERWRNDLFRECNWALVEFKALPSSNSTSPNANLNTNSSSLRINTNIGGSSSGNASTSSDPRTSSSLLLFEEYVPREYRAQLAHQILGIHPSVILNPSANAMIATSPSGRVRLGSLFASSSNVNVSTASLSLKKEKDKKKDKKDKMGGGLFSGSTRTLTSSTPTPYNDPRNGTATSTPTPYDSRSGATPTPYDSRSRSQFGGATPTPTPYDSHNGSTTPKQVEFDAMLAENRGTKVIRLARDGSQRDRDPERMDYEVDYGASPISRTISLTEEDEREDEEYTGGSSSVHSHLPEGAMPPRAPGASLPPVPTMPTAATATSPTDTPNTNSTAPPSAAPAAPSTPTTASTLFSRLPTSSKPKGPKDRSDRDRSTRRQSRQNLVPAEYHTVEFETRLMEGSGDDSADNDADAGAGGSGGENSPNPGLGGDAFLEEAAKRRRAARLAERERLRSERRGNKRFSLGRLGGGGGGGEDDDDEAWVDIVVPGYGGTPIKGSAGKGKGKAAGGDPEEASAEVARVLSAVRGGQPYPLDGDEDEASG
ncbi:hypothetical protein BT96DRAFT_344883 [Gymnopus androsaceus JB14]|uniref:Meiotically up-regulated protein Msb1/Mug8 domain-containing protein n=1 Tax=Gymnopus androsaceus JB14 TaxID=1447944 RepID=A0A6A4GX14_9AGAR|nr:hypothetical protein BT96DRAFT_344883 [Gymnopus androsaceus JB14]